MSVVWSRVGNICLGSSFKCRASIRSVINGLSWYATMYGIDDISLSNNESHRVHCTYLRIDWVDDK
jgi:hypothetical protein